MRPIENRLDILRARLLLHWDPSGVVGSRAGFASPPTNAPLASLGIHHLGHSPTKARNSFVPPSRSLEGNTISVPSHYHLLPSHRPLIALSSPSHRPLLAKSFLHAHHAIGAQASSVMRTWVQLDVDARRQFP